MSQKKETKPLEVNCFHCQKLIIVKYVHGCREYSKKNSWEYWTENREYKNSYICDDCLVKLYRQHKWEFRRLISNSKKQTRFRQYVSNGIINGRAEAIFITNKNTTLPFPKKQKNKKTKKQKNKKTKKQKNKNST